MQDSKVMTFAKVEFVNLTRETIRLGNPAVDIRPSGNVAKVVYDRRIAGSLRTEHAAVPVFEIHASGRILGLPDPREGVIYIVPPLLRNYLTLTGQKRKDVVSPWAQGVKGGLRWASALAR